MVLIPGSPSPSSPKNHPFPQTYRPLALNWVELLDAGFYFRNNKEFSVRDTKILLINANGKPILKGDPEINSYVNINIKTNISVSLAQNFMYPAPWPRPIHYPPSEKYSDEATIKISAI